MRVDLFDFDLPEERIALRPAEPRESARLLTVAADGGLGDWRVADLPDLLDPSDILVLNDTRVVPARLFGTRSRDGGGPGVAIEATLHLRAAPDRWRAFAKPAKRLRAGDRIVFLAGEARLEAEVAEKGEAGEIELAFPHSGPDLDAAVARVGEMPLPPYIAARRPGDAADTRDYQTVYARAPGAVAAPTAGLHMTEALMARLRERGHTLEFVTLHVGAGTFLPVKADDTADHKMHSEIGEIDAATAARLTAARKEGRRIIAVGTTALRLLESAASEDGTIGPFAGPTDIFITPGYRFRAVDRLMTNFHLPRSTLFMLVSAFSGLAAMKTAYAHAVAEGYRFYSYGDACLLERAER